MTALNQDITINSGDDYTIQVNVYSVIGKNFDVSKGNVVINIYTPVPLLIAGSKITIVSSIVYGVLDGINTNTLKGNYDYDCKYTNTLGKVSTLTKGKITFI